MKDFEELPDDVQAAWHELLDAMGKFASATAAAHWGGYGTKEIEDALCGVTLEPGQHTDGTPTCNVTFNRTWGAYRWEDGSVDSEGL